MFGVYMALQGGSKRSIRDVARLEAVLGTGPDRYEQLARIPIGVLRLITD
jgi:hypothetical protein